MSIKHTLIGIVGSILLLLGDVSLYGQETLASTRQLIREGNAQYASGSYVDAEVSYKKALEGEMSSVKAAFNLGDALYGQERFEEAGEAFVQASQAAEDPVVQARAYHNLGNSFLKAQKLQESVEAYKQALRRNPKDEDTRYNLAYALEQLRKQQQQNQQDQQNQDQENQDQDENQDQQDQDQQNEDQKNQDQQDQQKEQQNQPKDAQEQQGQQQQKMSPQEIEQMLEALRNEEQKLRKEIQKEKAKGKVRKTAKDW